MVTALDSKTIVVNFANIGRRKRGGDFAWSKIRPEIAGLHERGMKAVGVVYQNHKGFCDRLNQWVLLPEDVLCECIDVQEVPRHDNQTSEHDRITIEEACERNYLPLAIGMSLNARFTIQNKYKDKS